MIRIHKMLRAGDYENAVLLIRAAREVWPDDDSFGKSSAAPEEELVLLKEIYMTDLHVGEYNLIIKPCFKNWNGS